MSYRSITLPVALALMSATLAIAQNENAANALQNASSERGAITSSAPGAAGSVQPVPPTVAPVPKPLEPVASGEPHTEMLPDSPAADSLLDLKPLPPSNLSLVGGIARKVDAVHNRVSVQPFGGGSKYLIYFDERTRFLSDGRESTVLAIHVGDRLYADTQSLNGRVFARTIQVRNKSGPAQAKR